MSELFTENTTSETLYLETKWASLVSFGLTAQPLKDVLPVSSTANVCTLRRHLHRVAARHEADLGDGQPGGIEDTPPMVGRGRLGKSRSSSALMAATSGTGTTKSATSRSSSASRWP
jgi:hypothetical protein